MGAETTWWTDKDLHDMGEYLFSVLHDVSKRYKNGTVDILCTEDILIKISRNTETKDQWDKELYSAMRCPIDDLLLLINSENDWVKGVVSWRLENGR